MSHPRCANDGCNRPHCAKGLCEPCYRRERGYKPRYSKNRRDYQRQRRQTDINYRLAANLRNRIYSALKKEIKVGSAVADLGCSMDELKQHLEAQFVDGMNWENWSRDGWHIDHIVPLASFDLTDRDQFLKATHFTNLQPLWAKENISKGQTTK